MVILTPLVAWELGWIFWFGASPKNQQTITQEFLGVGYSKPSKPQNLRNLWKNTIVLAPPKRRDWRNSMNQVLGPPKGVAGTWKYPCKEKETHRPKPPNCWVQNASFRKRKQNLSLEDNPI